jgi:small subunit ribosomal protein S16
MLRIRLRRVGKKGKPSYRIVVADATAPRDGGYLEWIGNYDPMADPPAVTLKEDRAVQWLQKGAQPSDAVMRILDKQGILQRPQSFKSAAPSKAAETFQSGVPTVSVAPVVATVSESPAAEAEGPDAGEEAIIEESSGEALEE